MVTYAEGHQKSDRPLIRLSIPEIRNLLAPLLLIRPATTAQTLQFST